MPRTAPKKCISCSGLSATEAQALHGVGGDGCWNPQVCHFRRSYYRNQQRYIATRWQQRHPGQSRLASAAPSEAQSVDVTVPLPDYPVAVIQMYRDNASSDVHAVGAQLWLGGQLASRVEPVHCLGLTEGQVKAHLRRVLRVLSEHHGIELSAYGSQVSIDPMVCCLRPCPLHPEWKPEGR